MATVMAVAIVPRDANQDPGRSINGKHNAKSNSSHVNRGSNNGKDTQSESIY